MNTFLLSLGSGILLVLAGCRAAEAPAIPAALVPQPSNVTIPQNGSRRLTATVLDARGDTMRGVALTFSTTATALIAVSSGGILTSLGPVGSGQVVVSAADLSVNVPVTVTAVSTSIEVSPNPAIVRQNKSVQLTVTVRDAVGSPIAGAPVTFFFDSSMLLVTAGGIATPRGPQGSTYVMAVSGTAQVTAPVTVVQVPTTIANVPTHLSIGLGGYFPIRGARVLDAVGALMPNATLSLVGTPTGSLTVAAGDYAHGSYIHGGTRIGSAALIASYSDGVDQVADSIPVAVSQWSSPTSTVMDSLPYGAPLYGVGVSGSRVYATSLIGTRALLQADLPARQFGSTLAGPGGVAVAIDSAGATAYVASYGKDSVAVVDLATGVVRTYVAGWTFGAPRNVIMSRDGTRVYLAAAGIVVIDPATDSVVDSIRVPGVPTHLALHPTASLLYASLDNNQVAEIDTDLGRVTRLLPTGVSGAGVAIAPDGSELYNVTESNVLYVVNLASGARVAAVAGLGGYDVAASPDGKRLIVSGAQNVKIVDRVTRTLVDSLVVGGTARHVKLSRDGGTAFVANEGGWLNVIY